MDELKDLLLKPRLRLDEAAKVLDVSKRTVQNYLDADKLTVVRTPGGQRRVRNDEKLRQYL